MAKLRKYLNDKLRSLGGHTGYCIRPSERGKGYGTLLFGEVLKKAAEINIPGYLLCAEKTMPHPGVSSKTTGSTAENSGRHMPLLGPAGQRYGYERDKS